MVPPTLEQSVGYRIQYRVTAFLKQFLEHDPISDDLRVTVTSFIEGPINSIFPSNVPSLKKALEEQKKNHIISSPISDVPPKSKVTNSHFIVTPKATKNIADTLTLLEIDPLELSRQLTLLLFVTFEKIEVTPCVRYH
jgi:hypothetical protein